MDDTALFEAVSDFLREQVNPAVARHGGRLELLDVQDGVVVVRMKGGCQGCGMASVTLRQGVEASLRKVLPQIRGLEDVTDHQAGTQPYYPREPGR